MRAAHAAYQIAPRHRPSPAARAMTSLRRVSPARMRLVELGLLVVIAYGLGMALAFGI